MRSATFRFHGELGDFLPTRGRAFAHSFPSHASVKDVIESLGVPHCEVAWIVQGGTAVGFSADVPDGVSVAVHPASDPPQPTPAVRATPPLPDPRRYVLDAHMRRLAVYLRLLGFDCRWWPDADDEDLARVAAEDGRILLTRDRGLLKRSVVVHGRFVRDSLPQQQLAEVIAAHDLTERARPFTRCLRCNAPVEDIEKREVLHRLRPGTRRSYTRFRHCPGCDRVFWRGAHFARLRSIVQAALPEWQDDRSRDPEEAMTAGGHWWENFFEGLWLEYQLGTRIEADGAPRARAIAKLLGLRRGARVLDVPCGEGRIARGLASLGCDVTGIDLSKVLLTEAHRRAGKAGVSVQFERNDIRDLPYRGEFDAAVCYWGSFGYFDDVGNLEQLRAAATALVPGGKYVIDGHVVETLLPHFDSGGEATVGDFAIAEKRTWNAAAGRIEAHWTLSRGDRSEERWSSIRIYTVRELTHLLHEAGFTSIDWYGNVVGDAFELGSKRAVVVAHR